MTVKILATIPGGLGGATLMWFLFHDPLIWVLYLWWFVTIITVSVVFWIVKDRG